MILASAIVLGLGVAAHARPVENGSNFEGRYVHVVTPNCVADVGSGDGIDVATSTLIQGFAEPQGLSFVLLGFVPYDQRDVSGLTTDGRTLVFDDHDGVYLSANEFQTHHEPVQGPGSTAAGEQFRDYKLDSSGLLRVTYSLMGEIQQECDYQKQD